MSRAGFRIALDHERKPRPTRGPAPEEVDMAEIHVERKQGSSMKWVWVLVLLIVLALIGWWLWQSGMLGGTQADTARTPLDTISMLQSSAVLNW